jgi:Protein of unknown function (DUF1194)
MVTFARLLVFVIAVAVLVGSPVAHAAEEVDVLLVLSSDVSRSIDAPSFKLQRDGYAAAIVNPRVIQAIRSGALGKVAISFVEWSGDRQQEIVVDWTIIRDEATAKEFSAQIIKAPRASGTEPRSAAASILPWRDSPARRSTPTATPSMYLVTAPKIQVAPSPTRATRRLPKGSPSTVSSS